MNNCLRLSFAYYTAPDIREGIGRLGRAMRVAQGKFVAEARLPKKPRPRRGAGPQIY